MILDDLVHTLITWPGARCAGYPVFAICICPEKRTEALRESQNVSRVTQLDLWPRPVDSRTLRVHGALIGSIR